MWTVVYKVTRNVSECAEKMKSYTVRDTLESV